MRAAAPLTLLLLLLAFTGCSAPTAGFVSPVAHDYGPVAWQPLTGTVEQVFVAGPGYSAAVANDATTSPAEYQQRLAALPADARSGTLTELRAGLRPAADQPGAMQTGARLQLGFAPEHDLRFPERDFHAWPDDTVWLPEPSAGFAVAQTFVSPYPMLAGIVVRIATFGGDLSPGEGIVGPDGARMLTLPIDGEALGTLAPGTRVHVTGVAEAWVSVALPDGGTGWAPLQAFSALPSPWRRVTEPLTFTLSDANGVEQRAVTIPAGDLRDNAHLPIRFEPLPESAGREYLFALSSPSRSITARVTTTDNYPDGAYAGPDSRAGNDLVFRPLYDSSPPLLDTAVDALPRDGDWLRVEELPAIPSGLLVALRLVAGDGALEYGQTPGRTPYGSWPATSTDGRQPSGALLVRTYYERDVALWPAVKGGITNLRGWARDDTPFALAWLLGVATLALAAIRVGRPRPARAR